MASLVRTTDATVEPVTLAEAKAHMRVDFSADDTYIGTLITAARRHAENRTGRSFITQTWVQYLDAFPRFIELHRGDVIGITTLKYIDTDGALQTWDAANYQTDLKDNPARVMPARNVSNWPNTSTEDFNAVQVTYTAGYGATAASVPADIRQAVLVITEHLYGFGREVVTDMRLQTVPFSAYNLLEEYRLPGF